ncbi:SMI1/KNR4 family protein [Bacillus paramobilis]|uniref:SMI1/KNR4 family protein n=1 Tax=Bacillus paramobilis TaxID=2817477 RepID=UPI0030C9314B
MSLLEIFPLGETLVVVLQNEEKRVRFYEILQKSNMYIVTSVVIETESYRDLGMNENLVVIEDIGEYAYFLDTSNMENNECTVIAWDRQGGLDDYDTAKNFYEFLSQRLLDTKEAWEEEF